MIVIQKIESAALIILLLIVYAQLDASWWWLVALFLAPDLSIVGYLSGPKVGAVVYNVGHAYFTPAILAGASFALGWQPILVLAVIWAIHVAADRMLGFGLKLPTGFKDTHLGRL
jgi:hypothetical protein